jgi:secreted trypsin-like serine protease
MMQAITVAITVTCAALATGCVASRPDRAEPRVTNVDIVNGSDDDVHASVVALARAGLVSCSATLIAADTALTAAHCVLPDAPDAVLVGAVPSTATSIAVRATRADPRFDPRTLDHDIARVELVAPAGGTPTPPADAHTGEAFGATSPADLGPRRRHAGTVLVSEVAAASFTAEPSPAVPCGGDSGGAALVDVGGQEILVGVVSSGNAACDSAAAYTRVDAASFDPPSSGCSAAAGASSWPELALALAWCGRALRRRRPGRLGPSDGACRHGSSTCRCSASRPFRAPPR